MRTLVKVLYFELKNPSREKTKVIIYGAGEAGMIAKRALDRDAGTKYKVVAFIDDDKKMQGKKIEGINIYKYDAIDELLGASVAFMIISSRHILSQRKQQIIDKCLAYNVRILNVPPVSQWIKGELSFKQIKKINIEELLERDEIILDKENLAKQLNGKTILITGAAGSIGSEIVRQISAFNAKKIILLDQAESPLYDLTIELRDRNKLNLFEEVIADISNLPRMQRVFEFYKPEIVFHAAAYKHVPLMESNPSEAVITNILGTKNVADLSVKYKVEKFVMVSTDKAVNPTNVMGASKRAAEMYIQALSTNSKTKFITTRFGNVLGSNGSVIPLFKKQIEKGGPITLTHPDITRYFMTIPEACQLVLEAGAMGNGGEIFIFDMGKSIKILDLAEKMIKLSGLVLHRDIEIIYTGLRPGEKLYEELLNNSENTLPTHHSQIMIAKIAPANIAIVAPLIDEIINLFETQDNMKIVSKLKALVPEYISNNSEFQILDK
jgi:FlaA1/EpsC-like NDP-sugar epimerase